jgi:tRNA(Ile)-lysidine synthase
MHIDAPVCVAVSGGGDSMALMTLACDWAKARGRKVLALSVDHGLQAEGAAWSRFALEAAAGLGARTRLLTWEGGKPTTGLPAAARAARHALLAEAAREAGAGVILLAHTADDIAEAAVMRAEGSNLGDLRDWSPSPAWPEGRDVFLLRPLLGARRAELRAFLRGRGLGWIEDPANADTKYARSRARAALASAKAAVIPESAQRLSGTQQARLQRTAFIDGAIAGSRTSRRAEARQLSGMTALLGDTDENGGGLVIHRAALAAAPPGAARRFLSAALLSAAGTARPPRRERLDALLARLRGVQSVATTLAGLLLPLRIAGHHHDFGVGGFCLCMAQDINPGDAGHVQVQ